MEKFREQKLSTKDKAKDSKDPTIRDGFGGVSEDVLGVFADAQEEGTHYKEPNNNYKSSL